MLTHNVFSLSATAYIDIINSNTSIEHCEIKEACNLTVNKPMKGVTLEAAQNPLKTARDFPVRNGSICPNVEISYNADNSTLCMTYLDTDSGPDSGPAYSIGTWDSANNRYSWSPLINPLT